MPCSDCWAHSHSPQASSRAAVVSLSETSSWAMALNAALEVNAALLVDRLLGLRHAQSFPIVEPPAADAPTYLGSVYVDEQGQRWQELQLQLLAQHPAFLGVGT